MIFWVGRKKTFILSNQNINNCFKLFIISQIRPTKGNPIYKIWETYKMVENVDFCHIHNIELHLLAYLTLLFWQLSSLKSKWRYLIHYETKINLITIHHPSSIHHPSIHQTTYFINFWLELQSQYSIIIILAQKRIVRELAAIHSNWTTTL